jgi:hypothetical protein
MKKFVKSFTYKPKIDEVFSGICRKTTRLIEKDGVVIAESPEFGDEILFHEWSGVPYYSPWGRRLRVVIVAVERKTGEEILSLSPEEGNDIAKLDGIKPAIKEEYIAVLLKLNRLKTLEGTVWAIIYWEPKGDV